MTETPDRTPRTIDLKGIMDLLDFEPRQWIRGLKNISIGEHVFQGHFPKQPVFPGVLIVEAMAQTGGCLLMQEFPDRDRKVIYFMSIDGVKFRRPVVPGDQLVMEVKVISMKGKICKMRGEAFVDGQKAAEAEFMSMLMDIPEEKA